MRRLTPLILALLALTISPAFANDGASIMKRAPAEPAMVVHLDLQKLQKSALVRELIEQFKRNPKTQADMEKLRKDLGIDPLQDIEALSIALPRDFQQGKKLVFVADIKMDPAKLKAQAKKEGKLVDKKHGAHSYLLGPDGMALATPSKGVLILADEQNLHRALDAKGDLTGFLKGVDRKKDLWFAMELVPEMLKGMPPEAHKVKSLKGTLSMAQGLELAADLTTVDAKFAGEMAKMATAQINEAKGQPQIAMMGLAPIFTNLKVTAKGPVVAVRLKIGNGDLKRIIAMAKMMIGMGAAMGQQGGPRMPAPQPVKKAAPAKSKSTSVEIKK